MTNEYLSNSGSNNTNVIVDNNLYYGASTNSPGSWSDANAKYANPQLANAPTDMHIQSTSPARNSGATITADIAGTLDIDGQPRIQESAIDIGADEFGTTTVLRQYQTLQRKPAGIFSTDRSIIIYGIDPGTNATVRIFSMDGKCLRTVTEKNIRGMMAIGKAGLAAEHYWVRASCGEKILTGMVGVLKK